MVEHENLFLTAKKKNQEMCNKAVDNYLHALELFSECYKTQKSV